MSADGSFASAASTPPPPPSAELTPFPFFVVLTPFVEVIGTHVLWSGPTIPVVGRLDVTTEELRNGLYQGLRLGAVWLAFALNGSQTSRPAFFAGSTIASTSCQVFGGLFGSSPAFSISFVL